MVEPWPDTSTVTVDVPSPFDTMSTTLGENHETNRLQERERGNKTKQKKDKLGVSYEERKMKKEIKKEDTSWRMLAGHTHVS